MAGPSPRFSRPPAMALLTAGLGSLCMSPRLQPHHTPAPPGCLRAANASPLPRSDLQSRSFSTQTPACTGGCASHSEECRVVAQTVCAGLSANRLPCSPLWLRSSPSVLADLPTGEGLPRAQEPLLFRSSLPRARVPSRVLSLSFCFFSFCPTRLCGDPSCPFRSLRSSASVQ